MDDPQGRPKRRLKVDLDDLASAFDNGSYEMHFYLDMETGKVDLVTQETRGALEAIYEQILDEDGQERIPLEQALAERHRLADWEKEAIIIADQVERGFGERYIAVPERDSRAGYRDMEDFTATVGPESLQERLEDALNGRGAFRRFKDILARYPQERERWFAFADGRAMERVIEWLADKGIEPIP
jgi:hypothetical protein